MEQSEQNEKLTPEEAKEIRERYDQENVTYCDLAEEYGVTRTTVGQLVRRETYRHI